MSTLEVLYEKLKKYSNFDIDDNTEVFLSTVDKIIEHQDPSSIAVLLNYFEDNTDYGWVFQSISSTIENYPIQSYVDQLLINLPTLLQKSPIWADNFFNRILNHGAYLDYFKRNIHKTAKENILKLFEIMEQESPHHSKLINDLKKELQ